MLTVLTYANNDEMEVFWDTILSTYGKEEIKQIGEVLFQDYNHASLGGTEFAVTDVTVTLDSPLSVSKPQWYHSHDTTSIHNIRVLDGDPATGPTVSCYRYRDYFVAIPYPKPTPPVPCECCGHVPDEESQKYAIWNSDPARGEPVYTKLVCIYVGETRIVIDGEDSALNFLHDIYRPSQYCDCPVYYDS